MGILFLGHFSQVILMSQELDFLDTTLISGAFGTSAPIVTLLNGMVQGTTDSTRIGRRINDQFLHGRVTFACSTAAVGVTQVPYQGVVSAAVVYDKQANGAAPVWADVFTYNTVWSEENISNQERFDVLWREQIDLLCNAPSVVMGAANSLDSTMQTIDIGVPLGCGTHFNSNNFGDVRDIQTGALYLMVIANDGPFSAACQYSYLGLLRLRFFD